ncbi:hypothetical protein SDJN03_04391, partial [Cucurbita argyrosperma subsp. sororia]
MISLTDVWNSFPFKPSSQSPSPPLSFSSTTRYSPPINRTPAAVEQPFSFVHPFLYNCYCCGPISPFLLFSSATATVLEPNIFFSPFWRQEFFTLLGLFSGVHTNCLHKVL